MAELKKGQWSDAEKLGLLFQIIDKGGKIPWAELTLPAGRTKKACEVMISAERQKLKTSSAGEGKKRGKGDEKAEGNDPPAKKSKSSRAKKSAALVQDSDDEEERAVKTEGAEGPDFT